MLFRSSSWQKIADVISDAILILAPVRLVWKTKLSAAQKIRVMAIFSTTLITTAVSLNHAYFVLKWGGLREALAAVLQVRDLFAASGQFLKVMLI